MDAQLHLLNSWNESNSSMAVTDTKHGYNAVIFTQTEDYVVVAESCPHCILKAYRLLTSERDSFINATSN